MLAVIAAAGDRGVPRERLIALFWPDADEERARHSARQVLYGLRQELGREVVRSVGTTLSLDPSAISSDIGDFRAALAAGNREAAVGLARGPFLDAFYLPGASAFERWTEEERSRLATATTSALVALATDATRSGDFDGAVERWRQLTALDPLSGRYAVGFLKALAARGDRAEALAFARQHELVMRRELQTDPDPDVQRLQAELRVMPVGPANGTNGSVSPPFPAGTNGAIAVADHDAPNVPARPLHRGPRRAVTGIAAGTMLLLVVTAAFARQRGWLRTSDGAPTFAVGLVREEGVPDSLRSGRVITDMIATNLARIEGLRVLANSRLLELLRPSGDSAANYSDAARRAGATDLFEGQLLQTGTGVLSLELRRVELRSGIVRDVFRVTANDRYALVDSVTLRIGTQLRLPAPAGSVASATTNSLVAYRFYEEGLRAYYQGDGASAMLLVHAALAEDSTFAVAAWYEALLAGPPQRTLDGRHVTEARHRALRLAQRAPDRERLTIMSSILGEDHDPRSLVYAESLTTRFPDDPRALNTLSRARTGRGDFAGAVAAAERAIALDSAAELGESSTCWLCDDFNQLADAYASWDSLAAVQRTARRFMAMRPSSAGPHYLLASSGAKLGDSATSYSAYRHLASVGSVDRYYKLFLDATLEEFDVVERDVRPLLASSSLQDWGNGAWSLYITLRNQGRYREAEQFARTGWIPGLPALNLKPPLYPGHLAIVKLETGRAREAAFDFARNPVSDSTIWAPGVVARSLAWRGTLIGMSLAAAGDTQAVLALADSVERWGKKSAYGRDQKVHHYLRGMVHVTAGRHEAAVREFRDAIYSLTLGFTRVNYELARCLMVLNRSDEAIAVLQPALRGALDASNLYVSRTALHELLAEAFVRTNQRDSAAVHYRAVVKAWARADPMLHGRRDKAAAWLDRNAPARIAAR